MQMLHAIMYKGLKHPWILVLSVVKPIPVDWTDNCTTFNNFWSAPIVFSFLSILLRYGFHIALFMFKVYSIIIWLYTSWLSQ